MAKIKNNPLIQNVRGNVGKQFVYKKRGKHTHIALMPEIDEKAVATAKQVKVRQKFGTASRYAANAMLQDALKNQYEKKATKTKTAFNIAFRDYLKPPVVTDIDTRAYQGLPGAIIKVEANDDFRVTEVQVSIRTADGTLIEQGNAVLDMIKMIWQYTTTQNNPSFAGSKISATAFDVPGNEGIKEVTV